MPKYQGSDYFHSPSKNGISMELTKLDNIKSRIVTVRSAQVMVDSDLAVLFQVETKVLNQAVKRDIDRFPESFRFQLTADKFDPLRTHFVTLNSQHLYHIGASLKDLGKKPVESEVEPWFAFSQMNSLTPQLLSKIK